MSTTTRIAHQHTQTFNLPAPMQYERLPQPANLETTPNTPMHTPTNIRPTTERHNGLEIPPGTLHTGGDEIPPGTLCGGGEEIPPGTLHTGGGEEIPPGTLHARSYGPYTYRTKDGNAYFIYRYVELDDGRFEMDIIHQPNYNGRDTNPHVIHVLPSARGGRKICITAGCEPRTLEAAKNISMQWSELTWTYIRTGRTLDAQLEESHRRAQAAARARAPQPVRMRTPPRDPSLFDRLRGMFRFSAN